MGSKNVDFGLTYGFYALMGGFVVDVSDIHDTYKYPTLTTEGVKFLADRGHFLETSKLDIQGKATPDFSAKSLIYLQVGWLFVQSIARKFSDLPLSILEIHTFIHAVIALIMFILWFRVGTRNIPDQEPA